MHQRNGRIDARQGLLRSFDALLLEDDIHALSYFALHSECVGTIAPERGWGGHFHTFAVFLSTLTSIRGHCLLECRKRLLNVSYIFS